MRTIDRLNIVSTTNDDSLLACNDLPLSLAEVIDRQDRIIAILLKLEAMRWLRDDHRWLKEQAAQRRN